MDNEDEVLSMLEMACGDRKTFPASSAWLIESSLRRFAMNEPRLSLSIQSIIGRF